MPTTALIVAAGAGLRMGLSTPKAFVSIEGRPLVALSLEAFESHPGIDGMILVAPADRLVEARAIAAGFSKVRDVTAGGPRRQDSVRLGLDSLERMIDRDRAIEHLVLVHDAARPLVEARLIAAVIESAARVGAAFPGIAPSDTVRQTTMGSSGGSGGGSAMGSDAGSPQGSDVGSDDGPADAIRMHAAATLDRRRLVLVQTPQGFRLPLLLEAYAVAGATEFTDDAALVQRLGHPVEVVPGSSRNMKITTSADLEIVAAILAAQRGPDRAR